MNGESSGSSALIRKLGFHDRDRDAADHDGVDGQGASTVVTIVVNSMPVTNPGLVLHREGISDQEERRT